jgi:P27 family predicted phage terminase small subunit
VKGGVMMARKTKPIALHLLEGNKNRLTKEEINKRLEGEIKPNTDKVKSPDWLDETARKEWDRVVDELIELGLMTNVDVSALGIYCDTYSKYVQATEALNSGELVVEHTNKSGATNLVPSPFINIQNKYADIIKKFLAEFGLTPSARAKLALPKKEEREPTPEEKMFGDV